MSGGQRQDVLRGETVLRGRAGPVHLSIFRPPGDGPFPIFLYFPGGGFVSLSPGRHQLAHNIAVATNAITVCVDYHLAPQHVYPTAHDDCLTAWKYCRENAAMLGADPGVIALAGDSAGGTIAAGLTIMARDNGWPQAAFQFLAYPLMAGDTMTPSRQSHGAGLDEMLEGWRAYAAGTGDADRQQLAPLRVKDVAGLPPALVVTGGRDPLRDEGDMYAARLQSAGVPTTALSFPDAGHNFLCNSRTEALQQKAMAALTEAFQAIITHMCNRVKSDRVVR
jgi:acetyl esterase